MTIDEVTALMRWNVAMYSNSAKPLTDENAATQIAIWSAELADVPAYAGQKAMQKAFTVCRFPVTLADLCDQLRAIQTQYEIPSADAWLAGAGRKGEKRNMKGDVLTRLKRLEDALKQGDGVIIVEAVPGGYRLPNGDTVKTVEALKNKYSAIIIDDL